VYDSQYYDKPKESDDLQGYFDYSRDRDRLRATFRAYLKKIKKFKNAGNILDVGCAFGDFLAVCEEDGAFDTFGVEISRYAGEKAYKRLKGDIFVGDIQDFIPTKKMDIITLWDVLEHLNEPKKALQKCNQFIDPNGIILICTPNIRSFMFRIFRHK
jgi:2-polyprenyl-3-methyl-5-hydroxy-6-metoxy-1,4-benzoquinol methylase